MEAHPVHRFVEIDGRRHLWREILKLRREQGEEGRQAQLALFELKTDRRPALQDTADSRYREPTLFKID